MFVSSDEMRELIRKTNVEIEKILIWLDIKKLTLNVKSTFRGTQHSTRGHEIKIVESIQFLGVYLDSGLIWRN